MKKLSLVIAALAMVLGITQCKKQEDPVGGKLITQKVTFTTSFGNGSKLGVDEEGGTLGLSWQVGDKITVSDGQTEPSSTLECKSVSNNGLTGTFEGTITCIEGAELTFTVGTEPDYMDQHFTAITKDQIYLVGGSDFEQSGNYEVDMALPYAILKVDLAEFAPENGSTNVSVKINEETDPAAVVTGVKTDDCQVYLLLLLTATGQNQTTLTFTNEDETVTVKKSYSLASHGFYTGGGTGGFAPVEPEPVVGGEVDVELVQFMGDVLTFFYKWNPNDYSMVIEHGVCYGTSANPDLEADHKKNENNVGELYFLSNELDAGTTYHARAYAKLAPKAKDGNEVTIYSDDVEFITPSADGTLTVEKLEVTNDGADVEILFTPKFRYENTEIIQYEADLFSIPNWATYSDGDVNYSEVTSADLTGVRVKIHIAGKGPGDNSSGEICIGVDVLWENKDICEHIDFEIPDPDE